MSDTERDPAEVLREEVERLVREHEDCDRNQCLFVDELMEAFYKFGGDR